jgi:hypothetical protein
MVPTDDRKQWFAENLRRRMLDRGIRNFKKLSELTSVDHQLLRRWGSIGISRIDKRNDDQLVKVAQVLGLSNPDVLFNEPAERARRAAIDRATNPVVEEVRLERPELFDEFSPDDWDELFSHQGTGGSLNREGVIHFAEKINAKREIRRKFEAVLETHHFRTLAAIIDVLYRDSSAR